jgi:hypothetical protein
VSIIVLSAVATSDGAGDATFVFPDVPQGQLWCGTTSVPTAPDTMRAQVFASGQLIGSMTGPGSYGPWICNYTQTLIIAATGLATDTQYQAVWHADDQGASFSTYPAPITPVVAGTVTIPTPVPITGTITADQGSPPWQVDITGPSPLPVNVVAPDPLPTTTSPTLATGVASDQVVMTGSAVHCGSNTATEGVSFSAAKTNTDPIEIGDAAVSTGNGYIVEPGQNTPLFPVSNSDVFWAIGTTSDVLSFLVT